MQRQQTPEQSARSQRFATLRPSLYAVVMPASTRGDTANCSLARATLKVATQAQSTGRSARSAYGDPIIRHFCWRIVFSEIVLLRQRKARRV